MLLSQPLLIVNNTIGDVHDEIIAALINEGCLNDLDTEDNEYTWEYPAPIIANIRFPWLEPIKSPAYPKQEGFLREYRNQMRSLTPKRADGKSFTYTYGNRFRDYPRSIAGEGLCGDGDGRGIDQITESIVKRLAASPNSRRAVACTLVPEWDIQQSEPPCINVLQALIRDGVLRLTAYIRSNDMLSAWCDNANGLAGYSEYISNRINELAGNDSCQPGDVTTISVSAHLYASRDIKELNTFKAYLWKKGMLRV